MNEREQRGLTIAATCKIDRKGTDWLVPSQSGKDNYAVSLDGLPRCTCPDHETRGVKCKHIFAVEFVMQREENPDGTTTVTKQVTVTQRVTYRQDWPAYNKAQTNEKDQFQALLFDLCRGVKDTAVQGRGRPRLPLSDAIFAVSFKIYSTFSGRRFISDLREAHAKGYISRVPHFNSIFNYLENPRMTPILQDLIAASSLPLKSIESDFAVDSSGFSTSRFVRWFDEKWGKQRSSHAWVKCHLMCGVKTNVVTAVEIGGQHANDHTMFQPLVKSTARNFEIVDVSADKAYLSRNSLQVVADLGGTAYIPFKSNSTGEGGGLWNQMFHFFNFRRDVFLQHYHQRSNVESTFGMIKAKFRDHVRSKTDVAMKNEVLCKVLCHNICCVIQSMYELGVEPNFWAESAVAQKSGGF